MLTLIDQPLALEHQKICMTLQHNICKTYRYKGTEPGAQFLNVGDMVTR